MVEGSWPNTTQTTRVSFNVHNDRRSLMNTVGVWGRCNPPTGPEQSPGGGAGGKTP